MSAVTLSERIEAEKNGRKLAEIKELNLDGCSATDIEGLTDEYTSLESLSLVKVGLTSLNGLPALPNLTKLNVAENPISSGLDALTKCPSLVFLNISGNKLKEISDLSPLASLENLAYLELNNCDLASVENYRKEVFTVLPNLKFLDGLDQNGVEEGHSPDTCHGVNGVNGLDAEENGDDDDDEDENDDDEEEEVGISALQDSKELEDDEEDYIPGEEDGQDDDVDEEDEDDEDSEEELGENEIADLSGSGVTASRRATKRTAEDKEAEGVSEAKCLAPSSDC